MKLIFAPQAFEDFYGFITDILLNVPQITDQF